MQCEAADGGVAVGGTKGLTRVGAMLRAAGLIVFMAANCACTTPLLSLRCVTNFIAKDSEETGVLIYFEDATRKGFILRSLDTSYKIIDRVATDCARTASYPGNYIIVGRYNTSEIFMKNALQALTACRSTWNPSLRMMVILADDTERDQTEYRILASKLITSLWKKMVYDAIVFRFDARDGEKKLTAYTANPFDEKNDCGAQATTLTQLDNCENGVGDDSQGTTWKHPEVYPNCTLKVSRRDSPPFSFQEYGAWKGIDVRFIRMLRKRKHLSVLWSERLSSEAGPPLSVVHRYYSDLEERRIDIAIGGVVVQNDYVFQVQYLRSYAQTMLKYYVASVDILRGYDTIHAMFTGTVWLLLCSSIVIGGFCYNMLKESAFTFGDSKFFVMVAILSNQPIKMPKQWRLRLYLSAFLLSLYQISTLYYSSIQSYIIQNPYGKNIRTLEELRETGMPVYASETNLHLIDEAKTTCQKLNASSRSLPELLEDLNAQRNFSILARNIGVEFWTQLKHYSIRPLEEGDTVMSVSMALSKGSLYHFKIDNLVQSSLEGGLFVKWLGDLTIIRKNYTRSSSADLDRLSMVDVECGWILLLTGHFLACLAFVGEILSAEWKKKSTKRPVSGGKNACCTLSKLDGSKNLYPFVK